MSDFNILQLPLHVCGTVQITREILHRQSSPENLR
jgi:hypothetical protein